MKLTQAIDEVGEPRLRCLLAKLGKAWAEFNRRQGLALIPLQSGIILNDRLNFSKM
jgi:hypothetical protein